MSEAKCAKCGNKISGAQVSACRSYYECRNTAACLRRVEKAILKKLPANGSYGVRLRFYSEGRGERYFDSEFFGVWDAHSRTLIINRGLTYRGEFRPFGSVSAADLGKCTGVPVSIELSKYTTHGKKYAGTISGKILGAAEGLDEIGRASCRERV